MGSTFSISRCRRMRKAMSGKRVRLNRIITGGGILAQRMCCRRGSIPSSYTPKPPSLHVARSIPSTFISHYSNNLEYPSGRIQQPLLGTLQISLRPLWVSLSPQTRLTQPIIIECPDRILIFPLLSEFYTTINRQEHSFLPCNSTPAIRYLFMSDRICYYRHILPYHFAGYSRINYLEQTPWSEALFSWWQSNQPIRNRASHTLSCQLRRWREGYI